VRRASGTVPLFKILVVVDRTLNANTTKSGPMFGAGRLGYSNITQAPQMDLSRSTVCLFAENPGMGQVLRDVLEVLGAGVTLVPLAREPKLADTNLIVVEGCFEESSQFELAAAIRKSAARRGVLSLALCASYEAVARLKASGFDEVMTLPLSLAAFISAVADMLRQGRESGAREAAD
jgi:hypothetical protein